MVERYIGRILPGQQVCDIDGHKLGTVVRVYREDVSVPDPVQDDVLEVKTGLFGLGQRLYIPVSVVGDATDGSVYLNQPAGDVEQQWRERPPHLDRLT